jgi:uncharacterized phage-associated protein
MYRRKQIESIIYVANRAKNPTVLKVFNLLYLADLEHLSRYGRFITDDRYVAMENGPVPAKMYDLTKESGAADSIEGFVVPPKPSGERGREIVTQRDADLDEFSQSDLQCLDEIIANYGTYSISDLVHRCHDAAWNKTTGDGAMFADQSSSKSKPIDLADIVDMLSNADEVRLHLQSHVC